MEWPMRLLLVDDHVLFREGIATMLSAQPDFDIAGVAGTVSEAIALTLEMKPDLVLMDFTLPDGTGLVATRTILAELPDTNIVFLTVHEDDERLFAAVRSGAKGYLPKNISAQKLAEYLRGVERGEAAITLTMAGRVFDELARSEPGNQVSSELTGRELDILRALETGASNQEIANRLFISESTVKNHVSHILDKLNVRNRYEAAAYARRAGLAGNTFDLG
jgi:DNA-binding NarL/FixJ family response regulator